MSRRNTPTKNAVLNVLTKAEGALSQEDIEDKIAIAINRATIYRILNQFCNDGILHKILAENGKQYFALGNNCKQKEHNKNYFHFRCKTCETIECMPIEVDFSIPDGYLIESMNCVLTGQCKKCS
jgi:Fur family ferric uptake transcriptional regulator